MKKTAHGMTLIELMIGMSLVLIILGAGVPGLRQWQRATQVRTLLHELSADLAMARMAAISRGEMLLVCPGRDGQCQPGQDWSHGRVIFVDKSRNGRLDAADEVLLVRGATRPGFAIVSSQGRPLLRYWPNGMSPGSNLALGICDEGRLAARVIVNNGGRIRVERQAGESQCQNLAQSY